MRRMVRMMVPVCVVAVLLTGCGRERGEEVEDAGEAVQLLLDSCHAEISSLQETHGDAVAVARMREMLAQPAYGEIRAAIFQLLLDNLLATGDLAGAQAEYLAFSEEDEDLAMAGFRPVMQASMEGEDPQERVGWLERVLSAGYLPVPLRTAAWQLRMEAYAQSGSVDEAVGRVAEIMDSDVAAAARDVFSSAFSQGMRIGDYAGVESLLAAVAARAEADADLVKFVHLARGELMLAQDMPEEAWDHYLEQAADIGDLELSRRLVAVLKDTQRLERHELAARVVETAYQRGDALPLTRDAAASWAIRAAVDSGKVHELVDATQAALARGANVARFYHAFSRGCYPAMHKATEAEHAAIMDLLRRMSRTPGLNESMLGMMATARLDGAFFAGDFKQALAILNEGVPGFDEKWHEELRDKVGAHIALQEERYDDAVALFQRHIARVLAWENPVVNPESGLQVIKEVVIGFNEKRIGDIWSGVPGREADAAAAYVRARQWYQDALGILKADSPEYAQAAAELAAVPAAE